MDKIWVVRWEKNWGTRFERVYRDFFFQSEPTREAAVAFLVSKGFPADRWPGPAQVFSRPIDAS